MIKQKQIELLEDKIKGLEGTILELTITNNHLIRVNQEHRELNGELRKEIDKAIHRIQLLQMDEEVTIRDLGLIVRDLKGDKND